MLFNPLAGLDAQIQEIKESVELPLTHPEYYEEMGIKPPKASQTHVKRSLTILSEDVICDIPYHQ